MSSRRPHLNWKVPTSEWDAFVSVVREEHGEIKGKIGRDVDMAMREWIDADDYDEVEERIDRLVRAAGRTPESRAKKENGTELPLSEDAIGGDGADLTQVTTRVDRDLKDDFKRFTKEHTDDRYGIALARALRAYRQGGRSQRLSDKLDRITDDAAALLSETSAAAADGTDPDANLSTKEKRTIAMCRDLRDSPLTVGDHPIPQADINTAIESVVGNLSDYLEETYTPLILERIRYEPSPANDRLYSPTGNAEQQREENAEHEAEETMEALMNAEQVAD